MKKNLFIKCLLFISASLLILSCTSGKLIKNTKNTDLEFEQVSEKVSIYEEFEDINTLKYSNLGITNLQVAPYSKGIDIILTTEKKDFSETDFDKISTEIVKDFKTKFKIDDSLPIGVFLDYQPLGENSINIYSAKIL